MPKAAALQWVLLAAVLVGVDSAAVEIRSFSHQLIRLCLQPQYLAETAAPNQLTCAGVCVKRGSRCRGFRMKEGGVCQMFEFDRCDHDLNEADCDRFDWAFVRAQDGLHPGQMCPDGFGNRYLSSTYKMIDADTWTDGLNKCNSEPGELTKFADGNDRAEVDNFHSMKASLNGHLGYTDQGFYVGGFRTLTGTWYWHDCNSAFLSEVWGENQPDETGTEHNASEIWTSHKDGLDDEVGNHGNIHRALCECVSPFE